MSRARFFLDAEMPQGRPGVVLPLTAQDRHHALRVLRVRPGEELDLVAPSGSVWHVRVRDTSDETIVADVLGEVRTAAHPTVTLFQGVAKGDKMELIVRQAVEVGAASVVPVLTSRCVVRIDGPKRAQRVERWRRVSRAAAEQSRRTRIPEVHDVVTFAEALVLLEAYDRVIVLWEEQTGSLVSSVVRGSVDGAHLRVAVVVGPEGGLSSEEVSSLRDVGALVASLGPSIMRTETAAVVGLSLVIGALQEAGTGNA